MSHGLFPKNSFFPLKLTNGRKIEYNSLDSCWGCMAPMEQLGTAVTPTCS